MHPFFGNGFLTGLAAVWELPGLNQQIDLLQHFAADRDRYYGNRHDRYLYDDHK